VFIECFNIYIIHIYVELFSLNSFLLSFKSFLTCLICFISTILALIVLLCRYARNKRTTPLTSFSRFNFFLTLPLSCSLQSFQIDTCLPLIAKIVCLWVIIKVVLLVPYLVQTTDWLGNSSANIVLLPLYLTVSDSYFNSPILCAATVATELEFVNSSRIAYHPCSSHSFYTLLYSI